MVYGRRRRDAARYISQSDSNPATMGNRDQWVSNEISCSFDSLSTEPAPFPLRKGSTNISSRCLPSGFQPISTFCRSALALMVLRSFLWVFGIATCAISHVRVPEVSKCLYWPLCSLSRSCVIPAYLCVLKFYGDRENEYKFIHWCISIFPS